MQQAPMSEAIARRLRRASQKLGTVDPGQTIKPLLDRTFSLPPGDRNASREAKRLCGLPKAGTRPRNNNNNRRPSAHRQQFGKRRA